MSKKLANFINELIKNNKELNNNLSHIYMELYVLQTCLHNNQYCQTCKSNYEKYKNSF